MPNFAQNGHGEDRYPLSSKNVPVMVVHRPINYADQGQSERRAGSSADEATASRCIVVVFGPDSLAFLVSSAF